MPSGNLLMLYDQSDPNAHFSPDVLVAKGVAAGPRESSQIWEVGKAPELVIEVTSRTTMCRDMGTKKGLYESVGVQEYLMFDPRDVSPGKAHW
jgi:Uma2 family endonuclease